MGMTMTQKILAAHAGLESVVAGQLIEADLDLVLGNDITSPVAIHEIEIGTGTIVGSQLTNWVNGNIRFTNTSVSCVVIGNNGLKIENAYGGYVCIFNDNNKTYFRIMGLPESNTGLAQGQLFRQNISLSNFKNNLRSLLEEYTSSSGQKKAGYSDVLENALNGLPEYIQDIGTNL